jgi:iron complex outermembrane receptor protein
MNSTSNTAILFYLKKCVLYTVFFLIPIVPTGFAQDTGSEEEEEDVFELSPFEVKATEDLLVTDSRAATRIAVNLEDVPININSLSLDQLEQIQATDMLDAIQYAGVYSNRDKAVNMQNGDANTMRIRGFTTNATQRNGIARRYGLATANLERIEVVKGPASLTYGSANPGGTVLVISKKPIESDAYHATFNGTVGSYEYKRGLLDVGGPVPVIDNLYFRFVGEEIDTESYYTNYWEQQTLINPTVKYRPFKNLSLAYEYESIEFFGGRLGRLPYYREGVLETPWGGRRPLILDGDPETINSTPIIGYGLGNSGLAENMNTVGDGANNEQDSYLHEFTVEFQPFENWTFRYVYNQHDVDVVANTVEASSTDEFYNGGDWLEVLYSYGKVIFESSTHAADLTGKFDTGSINHAVVIGWERRREDRFTLGTADIRLPNGKVLPPGPIFRRQSELIFEPAVESNCIECLPEENWSDSRDDGGIRQTNRDAIFALDMIELYGGKLRFLGGFRWEDGLAQNNFRREIDGAPEDYEEWTYQGGVVYKPREGLALFFNYSQSFLPILAQNPTEPLPNERGEGYELGVRPNIFGDKLFATITIFRNVRDNAPVLDEIKTNNDPLGQRWLYPGQVTVDGFDLNMNYRPNQQVEINFLWSWLFNAELTKNAPGLEAGQKKNGTSEHSVNLWFQYKMQERLEGLKFFGGFNYFSSARFQGYDLFDESVIVDLGISYEFMIGEIAEMQIRLYGKNIFDEDRHQDNNLLKQRQQLFLSADITF